MKHTHRDHQRGAVEPCTNNSFGAAFETTAKTNVLFYCSFERLPDGAMGP